MVFLQENLDFINREHAGKLCLCVLDLIFQLPDRSGLCEDG